ncbi:MAG: hypothetical protein ACLGGX_07375 [Bdellovibrionia bacterium]
MLIFKGERAAFDSKDVLNQIQRSQKTKKLERTPSVVRKGTFIIKQ